MRDYFDLEEGNVLYGFSAFLLILFSLYTSHLSFSLYALIAETFVFLGPVLFMAWYMKIDIKRALSICPMSSKQWVNSFFFFVFLIPVSIFINLLSAYVTSAMGFSYVNALPVATGFWDVILQLFSIGLVTAISEEFYFRGMLLNAFLQKTKDVRFSLFVSSFLFAVLHFDIQNFLNPLFLGIIFAVIKRQTGSIWASVMGHAIINSFVVLMLASSEASPEVADRLPTSNLFQSLMTFAGIALISSVFAYGFYKKLKSHALPNMDDQKNQMANKQVNIQLKTEKTFLIPAAVLLFYCLLMVMIRIG
jgi:hypothetical protein